MLLEGISPWHGPTMAQLMACCLTAPSHHLNQCFYKPMPSNSHRDSLWHASCISKIDLTPFFSNWQCDPEPGTGEVAHWKQGVRHFTDNTFTGIFLFQKVYVFSLKPHSYIYIYIYPIYLYDACVIWHLFTLGNLTYYSNTHVHLPYCAFHTICH